ncbi:iron ABC transporter substrate-binding protein [Methanobrevibacter sp. 87.7]|uniref:ABC transporter substrate-binding protein n=1 Tax=Methanobrevibacter sp. 87.7 TaxID=387957 RepID=UPI000B4FD6B3|nr:ABC transporter substrate-binding protein [Methanobrevibacter sp. 87.7]OWT32644.1 iron ABC transporter substrate-binding protein [Methanobrevibacter sp. 87.7]
MDKKSKIILIVLIILIVALIGINIFLSPNTTKSDENRTISDMGNRTVQIPVTPGKVVSTSPPITTVLYMLAPNKLGGMNFQWTEDELKYVPWQYRNYANIGGWYGSQTGNYEQFLATEPDVIFDSVDESGDISDVNDRQKKFGSIPVVAVYDDTNITTMSSSIKFVGKVSNDEDKANKLCDFNEKNIKKVKEVSNSIPEKDKKTVYYAEGDDGLSTDPSGSTHGQLIDLCGGKNVAEIGSSNTSSSVQVSIEEVMKWNPEIIITTDSNFYKSVYNNTKWSNIKAVKNHQVYLSPSSPYKWFDRPVGANMIIGVPWTAKVIYPEKYKDINLTSETKEFYKEFYHIDLSDNDIKEILKGSGLNETNM